jgi:hypothetical protein
MYLPVPRTWMRSTLERWRRMKNAANQVMAHNATISHNVLLVWIILSLLAEKGAIDQIFCVRIHHLDYGILNPTNLSQEKLPGSGLISK